MLLYVAYVIWFFMSQYNAEPKQYNELATKEGVLIRCDPPKIPDAAHFGCK